MTILTTTPFASFSRAAHGAYWPRLGCETPSLALPATSPRRSRAHAHRAPLHAPKKAP
jgi:hypothetical protein